MEVHLHGIAWIHTLPSMKSCVPMLTTVHPMALAELRHRVWFSFLSQGLSALLVLIARSSMVPGTATFISLLHPEIYMVKLNENHKQKTR